MKSGDVRVKELARITNCMKAGQTSLGQPDKNKETSWIDKCPFAKRIKDYILSVMKG